MTASGTDPTIYMAVMAPYLGQDRDGGTTEVRLRWWRTDPYTVVIDIADPYEGGWASWLVPRQVLVDAMEQRTGQKCQLAANRKFTATRDWTGMFHLGCSDNDGMTWFRIAVKEPRIAQFLGAVEADMPMGGLAAALLATAVAQDGGRR